MKLRQFINLLENLSDNGKNDNLDIWNLEVCAENETQVYDAKIKINSHGRYIQLNSN